MVNRCTDIFCLIMKTTLPLNSYIKFDSMTYMYAMYIPLTTKYIENLQLWLQFWLDWCIEKKGGRYYFIYDSSIKIPHNRLTRQVVCCACAVCPKYFFLNTSPKIFEVDQNKDYYGWGSQSDLNSFGGLGHWKFWELKPQIMHFDECIWKCIKFIKTMGGFFQVNSPCLSIKTYIEAMFILVERIQNPDTDMIGWSKMNQWLHDIIPNRILLKMLVYPQKKYIQQPSNFNLIDINSTW